MESMPLSSWDMCKQAITNELYAIQLRGQCKWTIINEFMLLTSWNKCMWTLMGIYHYNYGTSGTRQ